ncbi:hypothetical protein LOD99_3175 [Oopsacas minuta]|uniref:Uncharacterized protein n=1 Tax=Oopsacas minuta TaxID=111878 RepID=A0AAV7JYH7_9METZ|nr:hypothetical protein LOD99_3175 [Oopsacas minuta]
MVELSLVDSSKRTPDPKFRILLKQFGPLAIQAAALPAQMASLVPKRLHELLKQRDRQAILTASQSDYETTDRLEYQRTLQANLRQSESEYRSARRKEHYRDSIANLRSKESELEYNVRLKSQVELYAKSKSLTSKRFLNLAKSQFICKGKVVLPPFDTPPELLTHSQLLVKVLANSGVIYVPVTQVLRFVLSEPTLMTNWITLSLVSIRSIYIGYYAIHLADYSPK